MEIAMKQAQNVRSGVCGGLTMARGGVDFGWEGGTFGGTGMAGVAGITGTTDATGVAGKPTRHGGCGVGVCGWIAAAVLSLCAGGCGISGFGGGDGRLTSVEQGSTLMFSPGTRVYTSTVTGKDGGEQNSMDIYLTDLPERVWKQGGDISDVSGQMVHIHMFMRPKAGATPIATTASTASVRWLVLSNGRVGVYGGGGFFVPSGDNGDADISGTLTDATLRLVHSTAGFADRLGPSLLSMNVDGVRDEATAAALARTLSSLIGAAEAK